LPFPHAAQRNEDEFLEGYSTKCTIEQKYERQLKHWLGLEIRLGGLLAHSGQKIGVISLDLLQSEGF
jgi:hypothetical protein